MKKRGCFLRLLPAAAAGILALFFLFTTGQKLFCGDWLLHEQPYLRLLQLFLRIGIIAGVLLSALRTFRLSRRPLYEGLCILVSCGIMAVLIPDGFGILLLLTAAVWFAADRL